MEKIFKTGVVFLLSMLAQGCVVWFPVNVDYGFEIAISGEGPCLDEVDFIQCGGYDDGFGSAAWGFDLYRAANLDESSIFLLPKGIQRHLEDYEKDCNGVVYPLAESLTAVSSSELSAFTNSVHSVYEKFYNACETSENIGRIKYNGSREHQSWLLQHFSSRDYKANIRELNFEMEHTLQALLLKGRYPNARTLYERHEVLKGRMLNKHPALPVTLVDTCWSGVRYELWTESGNLVGSLTIRYPFYMWICLGDDVGEHKAECLAMAKFLWLLRGKQPTKGMYSGVIRYKPLWGACDEGVCDFIDFFRLERQD